MHSNLLLSFLGISLFLLDLSLAQDPACNVEQLEECTKNLMRYQREDVEIPTTEQGVLDNCE